MNSIQQRGGWTIVISLVLSFAIAMIPLPESIKMFQPEWIILVVIYWIIALPQRIGVGLAWLIGLFMDVARGGLLGPYALALALLAFILLRSYQRIRNFPIRQQCASVFFLILIQTSIVVWIKSLSGKEIEWWMFVLPAVTSAVVWPLIYYLMRSLRRHYRVT